MSVAPLYPSSTNCRSDGTGVPSLLARSLSAATWLSMVCAAACCSPETLKVKSSPSNATIVSAEPQLFVTDIKRSCEFFREKLGFTLVFSYGRPPYYAQVGRDAALSI